MSHHQNLHLTIYVNNKPFFYFDDPYSTYIQDQSNISLKITNLAKKSRVNLFLLWYKNRC